MLDEPGSGQDAAIKVCGPGGKDRFLHLVRVPLEPTLMQSWLEKDYVRDLQIEITRGLRFTRGYPDPGEYHSLAGGKKSCVRILGLTFRRCPLETAVVPDEVGGLAVEPERPHLNIEVRNASPQPRRAAIQIVLEDAYGTKRRIADGLELPPQTAVLKRYPLPLEKYGLYQVRAVLSSDDVKLCKQTTLGVIFRPTPGGPHGTIRSSASGRGAATRAATPIPSARKRRCGWSPSWAAAGP